MMKNLLFTAALLVPGLAYGQNPSADLSVQVAPPSAGVACDYGPNTTLPTGTAGTDLAASGFTHCVLNADFTDNSGATGGSGWVMNNPNTWLNQCKGTTSWGLFWLMWSSNFTATNGDWSQAPCNRASLIDDGTGTHVLSYSFAPSDNTSQIVGMSLYWPLCGNVYGGGGHCISQRPAMPVAYYEEVVYKLASGATQPYSDIVVSSDSSSVFDGDPAGSPGVILDTVILEANANSYSGTAWAFDNYISACPSSKCSVGWTKAPDLANYHTYANLTTTDGNSTLSTCEYVDNSGLSGTSGTINNGGTTDGTYCTHWPNFTGSELTPHDRRTMRGIGNPLNRFTNTVTIDIKSIRIFACTSYRSNNCTASQSSGSVVWH